MPEQFTGTGSTFMLRVRGDSMIEAGIFDGDFVVVRQQPDAENGDVVVAGIPDGEATVKTFSRRRGKVVLTPGQRRPGADGVRPRRRHRLRQGRHRPAPALTPAPTERHVTGAVAARRGPAWPYAQPSSLRRGSLRPKW